MFESFPQQMKTRCNKNTLCNLISKNGGNIDEGMQRPWPHVPVGRVGSLKKIEWDLMRLS